MEQVMHESIKDVDSFLLVLTRLCESLALSSSPDFSPPRPPGGFQPHSRCLDSISIKPLFQVSNKLLTSNAV